MRTNLTIIVVLLLCFMSNAQTAFQKAYGSGQLHFNNKADHAAALTQTSDGGYIVAGYSDGTGLGLYDVYLVKFNSDGDTLWTRIYGGFANDYARSVIETSDGGIVVCGETESYGEGLQDALLFKTDSLGTLLWTKTYGGTAEDYGSQVIETSNGGLMVIGRTQSFGVSGGSFDAWAIKTDANGSGNITKTCYIQVGTIGLDDPGTRVFHSLAPNPFEHSTVLRYISRGQEKVVIRVFDLLGELVYSFEGFSNGGENEVEWSTMYPGVYILNARIGDRFISEKGIKL